MNTTTNPLIGTSKRETIQNAAEALSAAVVLLAHQHSGIVSVLTPVLDTLEREDVAGDADAVGGAAEAFSAALVLMADRHSDLCRLLSPVLQAVEHVSNAAAKTNGSAAPAGSEADDCSDDPFAEYNRRAAQVRAANEA